jgi:ferredoxin, 2Fe-2S
VPKITYVEANGTEHVIDVPVGWSLMEGAVKNAVPGILAECGGACACGTCRVLVVESWRARLGEPADLEDAMIDPIEVRPPGQRLSCQITVSEELDGLVVNLPEKQY